MALLFSEIAPRYENRPGGYTRIVRLGKRLGDAAEMCFLELLEETAPEESAATGSAETASANADDAEPAGTGEETEDKAEESAEAEAVEAEEENKSAE